MSTELRSFSAKRQKQSAADIRRQLSEQVLAEAEMDVSLKLNTDEVPLIDIEEVLSLRQVRRIEIGVGNGKTQRVGDYGEKDISINVIPRKKPFQNDVCEIARSDQVEPHICDFVLGYEQDYVAVTRNFDVFSTPKAVRSIGSVRKEILCKVWRDETEESGSLVRSASQIQVDRKRASNASVDSLTKNLNATSSDPVVLNVIDDNAASLFQDNASSLQQRVKLVALFPGPLQTTRPDLDSDNLDLPPALPDAFLSARFLDLSIQPNFEPVFVTAALYDTSTRRKVSENFHVDFNTREMLGLIRAHLGPDEEVEKTAEALFGPEAVGDDVYLVIRLEKVLQPADPMDASDAYVNKERSREKLTQASRDYCDRLGSYRMNLGWTFVPVKSTLLGKSSCVVKNGSVDEGSKADSESLLSADRVSVEISEPTSFDASDNASGSLSSQGDGMLLHIKSMYRHETDRFTDEDILRLLTESQRQTKSASRMKTFPLDLKVHLSLKSSAKLVNAVSAEFWPMSAADNESPKCREVLAFPRQHAFSVHTFYRNLLYIFPKSVNMNARPGNARNISIRVELLNGNQQPQRVFFGKSSGPRMLSRIYTSVAYHNKTPVFSDEIKMQIPLDMDDGFHLLFTFCHISCKANKGNEQVESPIGYTWFPLLSNNDLASGELQLPISLEPLPQGIGYLSPLLNVPNVRWLDAHKPLFQLALQPVSTVHPQDPHLTAFFRTFHALKRHHAKVTEADVQQTIRSLAKATPEALSAFLYAIFDKLIALISCPPFSNALSATCFEVICQMVKLSTVLFDAAVDAEGRSRILKQYIYYHRLTATGQLARQAAYAPELPTSKRDSVDLINLIKNYETVNSAKVLTSADDIVEGPKRLFHEELATLFVNMSPVLRDAACTYAWFFTGLIVKSCVEYLSTWDRFILPRKIRFRPEFLAALSEVCRILVEEAVERAAKNLPQANNINNALSEFVSALFCLLDRTFVLGLVRQYNRAMIESISDAVDPLQTSLMTMKLSFMQSLCGHEHFVVLNLPFDVPNTRATQTSASASLFGPSNRAGPAATGPPSPCSSSSLSDATSGHSSFKAIHYLIGMLFEDLAAVLGTSSQILHTRVIGLLRSVLLTHELDPRLAGPNPGLAGRVAAMYLPVLDTLLEVRAYLFDPCQRRRGTFGRLHGRTAVAQEKAAMSMAGVERVIEHNAVAGPPGATDSDQLLSRDLTKELLVCFGWLLKNVAPSVLIQHLQKLSLQQIQGTVELLVLCASHFEHKQQQQSGSPTRKKSSTQSEADSLSVKWRTNATILTLHTIKSSGSMADEELHWQDILEQELCAEMNLVVLDTIVAIVKVAQSPDTDHFMFVLPRLMQLLMHMLSCQQACPTLLATFRVQRAFVARFPELMFEQHASLCADLCLKLLQHLASRRPAVRSQAAASLYLLMRLSFERGLGFSKVKIQVTMALSTLVSSTASSGEPLNEDHLRRSLKTMLAYLNHDLQQNARLRDTSFGIQVRDLVFNLHMILTDTVQMKNFTNDFEMMIDLMFRVAKGYQNNPDLRLTWLINMANQHVQHENFAEAAQCRLHCAALVNEYLCMRGEGLTGGASALTAVSANVDEESAVSEDVVGPEEEGVCESVYFTERGLMQLVDEAATYLEKAHLFELVQTLYKVSWPLVERCSSLTRQAQLHTRVAHCLTRVEAGAGGAATFVEELSDCFPSPLPGADKRCLGTYFRVGLHGGPFGDLNGAEFVYKEPTITKLSEVAHRLDHFYRAQFGADRVEVVKDSNEVDAARLRPDRAYLQITYVEPYFELWERRRRTTHFGRNHDLRRFAYATPFTRDGKPHGELDEQFKRKTILTTQFSFPYMKTRSRVVLKEQRVLSPIEVAIEDLQKKTRELSAAVLTEPADVKMLQMVLQGCIGTTVNQGPLQIAKTFLSNIPLNEFGKPADRFQQKLLLCFKDFSKKCSDALQKNEILIQADQLDYQKELRRNFADFSNKLTQIVSATFGTDLQKCQPHSRTDRSLPVNLHYRTVQVIAMGGDMGPVNMV